MTTGVRRSRKPPSERPEVEHPGASVSSLRLSEQGYVGSGSREERDLSAPTLELGQTILSRATFDARAWALLGLATGPAQLTASRPVPCSKGSRCTNLRDFLGQRGGAANRFRVCDTQNVIWRETATRYKDPASGRSLAFEDVVDLGHLEGYVVAPHAEAALRVTPAIESSGRT